MSEVLDAAEHVFRNDRDRLRIPPKWAIPPPPPATCMIFVSGRHRAEAVAAWGSKLLSVSAHRKVTAGRGAVSRRVPNDI